MPLVSVIVPVYNVERYLKKCLDSIVEQTYSNVEIIVINDGSTDDSGEICERFHLEDRRIVVIHQENKGLSAARNVGITLSKGEFILFVDSDDWIEQDMIESLIDVAIRYDADIVCCGWYVHYEDNKIECHCISKQCSKVRRERMMVDLLSGVIGRSVWNKMWKADIWRSGMVCFPEGRVYEDSATVWKMISLCNSMICIPGAYYHYRLRGGSIIRTRSMKNICDRWYAMKERFDAFDNDKANQECRYLCLEKCLITAGYIWRWAYGNDRKQLLSFEEVLKEISDFVRKKREFWIHYPVALKTQLFFASHMNELSLFCCYYINLVYQLIKKKKALLIRALCIFGLPFRKCSF